MSTQELVNAEVHWLLFSQREHFEDEIKTLKSGQAIPSSSPLFTLHPFVDPVGVLRAGGRQRHSQLPYVTKHPAVLSGKHHITKLLIRTEHLRLLHAGPTLLTASLYRRYHIIGGRKAIRSVTRECIVCRRTSAKPQPQMFGQLPAERFATSSVFEHVGVDFAGPILLKCGYVRKPTIVKAYICVFVCLSVKALHLEVVSDLTTEAFLAALRRFIARCGKPASIWSDNGTNFVGAARELKELNDFMEIQRTQGTVSRFCSTQNI